MKSVELVGSSGSWVCSSLTSRFRKSLEVSEEVVDDEEDVAAVEVTDDAVVAATVMADSGSFRARCAFGNRSDGFVVFNSVPY
jgi:predicted RNA-binding protein